MTQSVCILGRQPALGLAELESLFGPENIKPLEAGAAIVSKDPLEIPLERLGGTLKVCKLLAELPFDSWQQIASYIVSAIPQHLPYVPEGKIRFGLSVYGVTVKTSAISKTGLEVKKVIKEHGRSVRTVPNKKPDLSTAQTIHNQLTGHTGMELAVIKHGSKTVLAQVTDVQDIEAYAGRDQARPKRDARVGMLPPKLAQIIINLAAGLPVDSRLNRTLLDPFCGTGVILQEALLMEFDVCGTDLDARMVDYASENLDWLRKKYRHLSGLATLSTGDATEHIWPSNINALATETYLGRPFSATPKPETLAKVMRDVDMIHRKFLKNLAGQVMSGFKLCIAVPAWKTKSGFKHLKTLDRLEELGYTRSKFVHARQEDLVYHREGQVVGRELVVLIRK